MFHATMEITIYSAPILLNHFHRIITSLLYSWLQFLVFVFCCTEAIKKRQHKTSGRIILHNFIYVFFFVVFINNRKYIVVGLLSSWCQCLNGARY